MALTNMPTPEQHTWLSQKDFDFIHQRVPRLCVDVVIRDRRGVVLARRDIYPDHGRWTFPGGTLRRGEKLAQAVQRFCRDETGLTVAIVKCLGPIEYFRPRDKIGHVVSIVFLARPTGGRLRGSWQGRRVSFFKSPPSPMAPEQRWFLIRQRLIRT